MKADSIQRIVVTGATGFLGHHLLPVLEQRYPHASISGLSRADYDLTEPTQVKGMFDDLDPDLLIHLSAYSAGIGANRLYPADFYYRNTMLTTLVFQEAAQHKTKKLIYTMGGCSYPASASSPIGEEQMWEGFPQKESSGYSSAKKMGLVASVCYRSQYGLNSVVLVPGNMYGEYDNFRREESHVVPAMIRKMVEAKREGSEEIVLWGTGDPVRDFVYATDVARVFPFFIEEYDSSEPVNISSGTTTSIRELAEQIKGLVNYDGVIRWDTDKPNGQMIKIFDVSRMTQLGLACPTPLSEGLRLTSRWFEEQLENNSSVLRV